MSKNIQNEALSMANDLMLKTSFIKEPGLMNGKLGIAIFFFHMEKKFNKQIYHDYATELLFEVFEDVAYWKGVDLYFENGLAGIGYGMEYLVENGLIDIGHSKIITELNSLLFNSFLRSDTTDNLEVSRGILGLTVYFLKRVEILQNSIHEVLLLRNKEILIHIIDQLFWIASDENNLPHEPKKWTLTWEIPLLFYLIGRLHFHKIFVYKTSKILERLCEYLIKQTSYPYLHSNKLLLKLFILKMKTISIGKFDDQLNLILSNLDDTIDMEQIRKEIDCGDPTLLHGTSGINLVYHQLTEFDKSPSYHKEVNYWKNVSNKSLNEWPKVSEEIGLFSGISGALLNTLCY